MGIYFSQIETGALTLTPTEGHLMRYLWFPLTYLSLLMMVSPGLAKEKKQDEKMDQ